MAQPVARVPTLRVNFILLLRREEKTTRSNRMKLRLAHPPTMKGVRWAGHFNHSLETRGSGKALESTGHVNSINIPENLAAGFKSKQKLPWHICYKEKIP